MLEQFRPPPTAPYLMPTQTEINHLIARILGKKSVSENDHLIHQLGAESIDIVNIVATLEEQYGVHIPETELAKLATPADFLQAITP